MTMKKEDFKVGGKYKVKSGSSAAIYTCVGTSLDGFPIMECPDVKPFQADYPDRWVEYKEPREFFLVLFPDNGIAFYREESTAKAFAYGGGSSKCGRFSNEVRLSLPLRSGIRVLLVCLRDI